MKKKWLRAKCVVAQGKEAVSTAALVMVRARSDDDHIVSLTNGETGSQDYLHCMASRVLMRELLAKSIKGSLVLFHELRLDVRIGSLAH